MKGTHHHEENETSEANIRHVYISNGSLKAN